MSEFKDFRNAVSNKIDALEASGLLYTDTDKDELWEAYLESFKEGTNPIYKERTEHDCQCCKQFIRACGSVVAIVDGELVSVWDIEVGGIYQVVADALSALVKSNHINNKYLHYEAQIGVERNHQVVKGGNVKAWDHFSHVLGQAYVVKDGTIDSKLGSHKTSIQTFNRALESITPVSVDIVLDLMDQNSLYRGEEHKASVERFKAHQDKYKALDDKQKGFYLWSNTDMGVAGIRNSVIGSLLVDLSEGKEIDQAVNSFEDKVSAGKYKRTMAVATKGMIDKAEAKFNKLGLHDSIDRRYAYMDDLTINNVIFANRATKKSFNVFDEMKNEVSVDVSKFDKVEEIGIDVFIRDVLPKADAIEMMFANNHINNLVSLIAPEVASAPNILKWDNNFSWSYNGEVADSIKERVKNAGGNVDAYMRVSLSWYNTDDLDIHVIEPNGNEIFYGSKISHDTGGRLDVDMNVNSLRRDAVENIMWANENRMIEGEYKVFIRNYTPRETVDVGFEIETEWNGKIKNFAHPKRVTKDVSVLTFTYSKAGGVSIRSEMKESNIVKEAWGINTQGFHNVSMVMNSPNHWDGESTGNKHWFFMLDKCNNEKPSRGFYNEFLRNEFNEHRKVFELLGSKMKTKVSDNQLSGLGFSSTKRDSVLCRVSGSFNRVVKINF